jgi:hypothetical protein
MPIPFVLPIVLSLIAPLATGDLTLPAVPPDPTARSVVASETVAPTEVHAALARPRRAEGVRRGLHAEYGARDDRGCRRLLLKRGTRTIKRIPSQNGGCSVLRRQVRIGDYLYFDWRITHEERGEWRRRTDIWTSKGTKASTYRMEVLREQLGRRLDTCAAHWAKAGGTAIAGARWCWDPDDGDWVSGRIAIHIYGRFVRNLPVPRMRRFAMAGRRIVTTGQDSRGRELWIHDNVMTRMDLRPGPRSSNPRQLDSRGDRVRFIANDGNGKALWVTDGTVAGTKRVRRLS